MLNMEENFALTHAREKHFVVLVTAIGKVGGQ